MIRFFASHPTSANLLMLMFLAAGLLSLSKLRRETFPDDAADEIEIRVVYPGATPEEVEEVVSQRVENALDSVRFVEEVRSDARDSVAVITVKMEETGNFQEFKDEIRTEVDAIDDFPEDVEDPIIKELGSTERVLDLLVAGPMTTTDLKAYCEDLKLRLQQLPEIAIVQVRGFSDHQLRIELSRQAVMQFGISAADVADIVARQNLNLPAGTIDTRERELVIRMVEQRRTTAELEDIVVLASAGGAEIRLGDIATVTDVFELAEEKILLGDDRAGMLTVEKTKNQDTIRVAEQVRQFVDRERERMPPGMQYRITRDVSTLVSDRLQMLLKNMWQGMALVFLVMWLFFNFRLSFWVVMSLPVSFLGAICLFPQIGLTINMITMVGLLLALGLLMDDGIVIAENIATHFTRGKSAMAAAIDGVREVSGGVLSSFLTTVCIFGPLMFLSGEMGKVLRAMPLVLIVVLAVSLVEAFLILPAHLGHSLGKVDRDNVGRFRRKFDAAVDWTRERLVGKCIDALLPRRYLWVGTVVMLFLLSLAIVAAGILKFQPFPALDGNFIEARLLLTPGTPLKNTERVVQQLQDALDRVNQRFSPLQPDGQQLIQSVNIQFNRNPDAMQTGPHVATVAADLLDAEIRTVRVDDVLQAWQEETGTPADVLELLYTEPIIGPGGREIEIRLSGNDLNELKQVSLEMVGWLSQFDGVLNLADDTRVGKEELRLRLREGAFGLGLDAAGMARQLRAAFQGVAADEIQLGNEAYEIDVRLDKADQNSLADLEYFHFTLPDGAQVPLGAVAVVERARGWSRIARVNSLRTITIRGDVDSRRIKAVDVYGQLQQQLWPALSERHPTVRMGIEGEHKDAGATLSSMGSRLVIGLLGVFALLSFQFRSYVEPLVVMTAIPFALIGVVWGHLLTGTDLTMPSMMGFASLAGIVVNDSILLVLFLKRARAAGADLNQAAAAASRQRFRAIALTSLTTIAGLLPFLFERSTQAQVLIPLAVSIVFGLLASTLLVLLVVPCLYAIVADLGLSSPAATVPANAADEREPAIRKRQEPRNE